MAWDPDTYLAFAGPRLRPAVDLVARIGLDPAEVAEVVDLGAGSGNLVGLLRRRFPAARVTAVDADEAMVARAREEVADDRVEVVLADAATWAPPAPVDLLFSNAALHWLDDHDRLLPRLLGHVRPGGVLAVQLPRNHDAPSHRGVAEVVREGPWAAALEPHLREHPVATATAYHRLLAPLAAEVDAWSTTYVHHLAATDDGTHPVAAWLRGSTLRPLLAALEPDARPSFLSAVDDRMAAAYPTEPDGSVRFGFTRVFLVAVAR